MEAGLDLQVIFCCTQERGVVAAVVSSCQQLSAVFSLGLLTVDWSVRGWLGACQRVINRASSWSPEGCLLATTVLE